MSFLNKAKSTVLAAAALVALSACANDRTASFVDPDYQGQLPKDWRVAVAGANMGLNEQMALIDAARGEFDEYGIVAVSSLQIVPPTRELTVEEFMAKVAEAGAQAVLEIEATDRDMSERTEPVSYFPGHSSTTVYRQRSLVDGGGVLNDRTYVVHHRSPDIVSGGYSTPRATGSYIARLIDVETRQVVWRSDTTVTRSTSNYERLARATAEEFVEKLIDDGVLIGRAR